MGDFFFFFHYMMSELCLSVDIIMQCHRVPAHGGTGICVSPAMKCSTASMLTCLQGLGIISFQKTLKSRYQISIKKERERRKGCNKSVHGNSRRQHQLRKLIQIFRPSIHPKLLETHVRDAVLGLLAPRAEEFHRGGGLPKMPRGCEAVAVFPEL